jgi:hypothetical protein
MGCFHGHIGFFCRPVKASTDKGDYPNGAASGMPARPRAWLRGLLFLASRPKPDHRPKNHGKPQTDKVKSPVPVSMDKYHAKSKAAASAIIAETKVDDWWTSDRAPARSDTLLAF